MQRKTSGLAHQHSTGECLQTVHSAFFQGWWLLSAGYNYVISWSAVVLRFRLPTKKITFFGPRGLWFDIVVQMSLSGESGGTDRCCCCLLPSQPVFCKQLASSPVAHISACLAAAWDSHLPVRWASPALSVATGVANGVSAECSVLRCTVLCCTLSPVTAVDGLLLVVACPAPTALDLGLLLLIDFAMADALRVTNSSFSPLTSADSPEILRLFLATLSYDSVAREDSVCTTLNSKCSIPGREQSSFVWASLESSPMTTACHRCPT